MKDKEKRENNKLYRMAYPYDRKRYNNSWTQDAIIGLEYELRKKQKSEKSKDTLVRQEIYAIITNMLAEGYGKVQILTYLHNKYPESPLAKFFEGYIDNQIRKSKKNNTLRTNNITDKEER